MRNDGYRVVQREAMAQTKCDLARWPLVHFTLGGKVDNEQINVVVNGLRDALVRKSPFAAVTDLTDMEPSLTASRDPYRDFIDNNRDELRKFCRGGALVVTSHAMRIVVNTFVLVAKIPFPSRAFNSQAEAVAWCSGLLRNDKVAAS
jgi:hypothetical protein